ncbi:MAG: T9SS type A sorting domain-containing protein [Bacteroidetes bacterium]|nr:T9SS type A sorting domain-containing protein [Bacteroidota bacterium]
MKKSSILLAIFLLLSTLSFSQMVQQIESFESASASSSAIFPSPGWRQQKYMTNVSGAFVLQPVATATNPACGAAPSGGTNLMMFNSFTGGNNDTAIIITKPFDFSNNAGNNPQFSFYMYRDNGFAANDDHILVYVNTSPNMTGATLLSNTLGTIKLPRNSAAAPAATANTWNLYTYDLAAATYTAKRYYFIIMGVCKDGNNIYLDRVTTNTYPSPTNPADVSVNLFYQNIASVGPGTNNSMVVGMRCIIGGNSGCGVVNGALSTALKLDSLLLNTNGTTSVADIANAKIYYTGGSILFDTTYVSPFPITAGADDYPSRRFGQTIAAPGTNMDFMNGASSCTYLEYDTTYFWLTYDVKPNATVGNLLDANLRSVSVGGAAGSCPSPGGTGFNVAPSAGGFSLSGASLIDIPYCIGTYTQGTSGLNFSYTNNDYITHVILNGASGTAINTTVGAKNNNTGLPNNLACLVSNGGPGCDFTSHPPDYELWPTVNGRTVLLNQGAAYSVSVRAGTWPTSNNIAVFIDYNHDGDFIDAGEKLGQVNLPGLGIGNIPFVVPVGTYFGPTRMRVREVFANSNIDPCSVQNSGEIEDFTVTISPNCPVGNKLWLGYTVDWQDPANWCGGVPAISDDAIIDRAQVFPPAGVPTRPYYRPTIKSNIIANAKNLTISNLDSIVIDAPAPSFNSLKVARDLTNNGKISVVNSYMNNIVAGNGTIVNNTITPFKAQSTDARTQLIYTASELASLGFVSNDNINGLEFSISLKGSSSAYNGFTLSYALVPFSQHSNSIPYSGAMTTVLGPVALTTVLGLNTLSLTSPIVWDGTSNLLIQFCFDNSSNIGSSDDRINITQTTGIKSTLVLSSTTNAASGCALVPGAGVTDNFFSGLNSYRPNFTFLLNRPYAKAIIRVQEDWINNGTFEAGYSRVVMDSTVAQTISGSQVTTFNELEIHKGSAAQTVTMQKRIIVDSSLVLTQGCLLMNGYNINMNNPSVSTGGLVSPQGPFARTNGFIISENQTSIVLWKNINSLAGYRVVPFGSKIGAPLYIPFSFTHKSGNIGNVSISTYYAPGNLPLPNVVTHLNNTAIPPANNAAGTVDRFWMVEKTGNNPVTDIVFRFTTQERATGISAFNQGKAQPYRTTSNTNSWMRLVAPYTSTTYTQSYGTNAAPGYDSVRVVNWDWPTLPQSPAPYTDPAGAIGDSHPWIVTLNTTPCGYSSPSSGIFVSVTNVTNETCAGFANGSISISVSGGSAPYAFLWSNGSASQNLNALSAGTYTVTITDSNGATASASATVNVSNQLPSPLGAVNGPATVCPSANGITYVVPTTVGATSYQWVLPTNMTLVSGQGTNVIVVNVNSSFSTGVLCVSANNVCGSTSPSCLLINASATTPSTPSSITGSGYGVCGLIRNYSVTNVANVSYLWSVPAGATVVSGQGTNAVSIQYSTSFTSGAISVVAFNVCGTSNARNKTIYGRPSKPTVINGPAQLCISDTVVFSTVAVFGNNTYTWTMPTGLNILSGQNTTSVTVKVGAAAVAGDVCVKAKNSCGSSGNFCLAVNIIPNPLAIGTITGSGNGVCNATKNYSVVNQVGVAFNWSVPAGATLLSGQGTNAASISFSNSFVSGNIVVTGTNTCGNSTSASKTIKGKPAVPASITGPASACFNGQNINYSCSNSTGASSYTWTIPAGATLVSGQGTNAIVLNFASTVGNVLALKVKASNACGTSSNRTLNITMLNCPRLENSERYEIALFPNPTKDELTVSWLTDSEEDLHVTCIDILGQHLLSKNYESAEIASGIKINTSNFSNGVYFVRLTQGDVVRTRRFVVKQ